MRSTRLLAIAVGLAYLLAGAGVMALEDSFIYFPTRGGRCTDAGHDVWLTSRDGTKLHARHVEVPDARASLLYLHGNAGNVADRSSLVDLLATLGADVLALDYHGYGQSEGTPSEAGFYDDASAAFTWLQQRDPHKPIVVLGESLGGGPATELAVTHPIAGLILQSTFTSIPAMAALTFPWLPTRLLVRTRFDNLAKLPRVRVPTLIIHSERDEIIPASMGDQLFAAANEPKRIVRLRRSGHNDAYAFEPREVLGAMGELIAQVSKARGGAY